MSLLDNLNPKHVFDLIRTQLDEWGELLERRILAKSLRLFAHLLEESGESLIDTLKASADKLDSQ